MESRLTQEEIEALLGRVGAGKESAGQASGASLAAEAARSQIRKPKARLHNVRMVTEDVTVAPAVFQPIAADEESFEQTDLSLLLDTELEISAELGRAVLTVREVLDLGPGSVIELNKLSGEPVDLYVNGRKFSRGEVVVIAENFGIRITDILSVEERIEALAP